MNHQVIADFVKRKRQECNWSQTKLANKIGVHYRTIQNLEANKPVSQEIIDAACSALGYQVVISIKFNKLEDTE